ncbi:MAG: DNA mismatch repair protein MutS [Oscillospiraceae bacterium]
MAQKITPMRKQYLEMKEKCPDCLLFFRLGDFYEMFDEDARIASKVLDLTLTTRDRNKDIPQEEKVPMCGVPYHSYQSYLARLVAKGYKVAICEQTQDPAAATGIVERDIIRIVTPGTAVDASMLEESRNNYIAAIYLEGERCGVCFCDLSTGEVYATACSGEDCLTHLMNELGRFEPREVVLSPEAWENTALSQAMELKLDCRREFGSVKRFDYVVAGTAASNQFENYQVIPADRPEALQAVGGLLSYLYETQKNKLGHLRQLQYYASGRFMELDLTARRNLELTETLRSKEKRGSLLWVLDKTKTAMGGRLLRRWLEKPLLDPVEIRSRLMAVRDLTEDMVTREELALCLKEITDLERLIGRIVYGTAGGRDLVALSAGLHRIPKVHDLLATLPAALFQRLRKQLDELSDLCQRIDSALVEEPPFSVRDGGIIREGYSKEVDQLRNVMTNSKDLLVDIENRTKETCGIKNIRVKYNKVFGYYIEVAKSQTDLVPADWVRKQTTVNSERYINQELKELEHTILSAKDRITDLEYDLFCQVRQAAADQVETIQQTAAAVAQIDVLNSLAVVAASNHYCMPEVDESDVIDIIDGRHPVVERVLKGNMFVPNDTHMNGSSNLLAIITGPNMAGKSTYMRQVALICLMAQIGSFVPAKSAHIGVVDRVFTRIGASDDLAAGQSTFMVEMSEVAEILKNATNHSLLILDEIGRGTSTYDGMSIARAVLEHCADKKKLGAKTLFATHYHELSALEGAIPGVRNYHMAAKKRQDDVIFLRKLVSGGADQSYGIEVAQLAGVPAWIIRRGREILKELEAGERPAPVQSKEEESEEQMGFADLAGQAVLEELRKVELNTLTPIEAMNLLYGWKAKLDG